MNTDNDNDDDVMWCDVHKTHYSRERGCPYHHAALDGDWWVRGCRGPNVEVDKVTYSLTIKQLRNMLFHIEDQDMTIRELRTRLFNVEDQDAEMLINPTMWQKLGIE